MGIDRRGFLKITGAGVGALGVAGLSGMRVFAPGEALASTGGVAAGPRMAMVVDTRKGCPAGCRDCIAACHATHNVPDHGNPKDEVKWLWKTGWEKALPGQEQPWAAGGEEREALVLCNHCDNPPCVRVCPTQATYRRPDGIINMDFHRCIGCRFCMAACPFGSRSFNWKDPRPAIAKINPDYPTRTRGVVEKCTFCVERLEQTPGSKPYCVEACKEKMLAFGDLTDARTEVRELLRSHFTVRRKADLGTRPQVYYIV